MRTKSRSTHLLVIAEDVLQIYNSLLHAFPALRSYRSVQDIPGKRRLEEEVRREDIPGSLLSCGVVAHYVPPENWSPQFELDHDGAPLRLLNAPDRRFATLLDPEHRLDLSRIPEHLALQTRRDPVRQSELREMYRHDRLIGFPSQEGLIYGYYPVGDEQQRLFVSRITAVVRRPTTNRYRQQDMITGEILDERTGTDYWAGADVQRRCREERDFYALIGWSTEQRRWIGWKTMPREPRRRASSR